MWVVRGNDTGKSIPRREADVRSSSSNAIVSYFDSQFKEPQSSSDDCPPSGKYSNNCQIRIAIGGRSGKPAFLITRVRIPCYAYAAVYSRYVVISPTLCEHKCVPNYSPDVYNVYHIVAAERIKVIGNAIIKKIARADYLLGMRISLS